MNLLDLHIIHNYPLSCLCRDENGSPKSVIFGGTIRARISSQSIKRAIREYLKSIDKKHFGGIRMRSIATSLTDALKSKGVGQDLAQSLGNAVADMLGKSEDEKTKTILFFSPGEIDAIAETITVANKDNTLNKIFKIVKKEEITTYECQKGKFLAKVTPIDIADVELFGRMVASDPTLFVEGAVSVSHPFSVHSCEAEVDFFSSVDETAGVEEQGAGHIGEIEYNSACYYECISINMDLINSGRLSSLPGEIRKDILQAAIDACIIAVPSARHNSMFAATKPSAVFGLYRENTFPVSLANAFERPIQPSVNGYSGEARKRIEDEWKAMKNAYGKRLGVKTEMWFPDVNLDTFGKGLVGND
jgi:CRISPR system Cascade subunit CasC